MATFETFKSDLAFKGETQHKPIEASRNNTDVIAPEIKLYIEGVQVPFETISISQTYLGRPTADIQIPPESGLMDINKGYEPKVHIFYRDDNYGGDRLLFWGMIKSTSYARSRSQGSGYITFHCEHKNSLLGQMTLDYTGWAADTVRNQQDPASESGGAGPKVSNFNSTLMIIDALGGLEGVSTEGERIVSNNVDIEKAPVNKLDPELAKLKTRLHGMPGVMINLWNQIKKGAYINKTMNLGLTNMYIPLYEEGLSFFKRTSGHPLLETRLQGSKEPYCNHEGKWVNIIVPPYCRTAMTSAVQREMAVRNLSNIVGFSGELSSFDKLLLDFFVNSQYDMLTLASPAEIAMDPATYVEDVNKEGVEKVTIETIIKPQIPFYFSPTCNVILPRMYHSIQVNQDGGSIPTRISATHDAMPRVESSSIATSFKGPASYREAVAYNALLAKVPNINALDLASTKGLSYFIPAKYEQGMGIRHEKIVIPWWLVLLIADKSAIGNVIKQEKVPEKGDPEFNNMLITAAEWNSRNAIYTTQEDGVIKSTPDKAKEGLNPYDPKNASVLPHERIMFSTIDYEYSKRVAASRNGTIEALFNPYVIPGYPIDVIDDSPNHPSFHGFCTSVIHTITPRAISTTISMAAAVTYAELSNYYTPPVPPFLQSSLNMVNGEVDEAQLQANPLGDTSAVKSTSSVLIQNPKAKQSADQFYREVLGVGAVAPDDLVHFALNRAYPLDRKAGVLIPRTTPNSNDYLKQTVGKEARQKDDYYSSVGNLRLVSRPIESKESIQSKFKCNFIDMDTKLYNNSFVNYVNPKLAQDLFLEPGASLFLDYMETKEFITLR